MITWHEVPPIIKVEKYRWVENDIQELENTITCFYVKTFDSYFHQRPIVPCHLLHVASLYHIPDPPKITVLNPCPNMFYNVSVLSLLI